MRNIYKEGDPEFTIFSVGYGMIDTITEAKPYIFFSLQFQGYGHRMIYIEDEDYAPANSYFADKYPWKYEKLADHWYIEEKNDSFSPAAQTEEVIQEFIDNIEYFETIAEQGLHQQIFVENIRTKRYGTENCDAAVDRLLYDLNYYEIQTAIHRKQRPIKSIGFYKLLPDKWIRIAYWAKSEIIANMDNEMLESMDEQNIFGNWYVSSGDFRL